MLLIYTLMRFLRNRLILVLKLTSLRVLLNKIETSWYSRENGADQVVLIA